MQKNQTFTTETYQIVQMEIITQHRKIKGQSGLEVESTSKSKRLNTNQCWFLTLVATMQEIWNMYYPKDRNGDKTKEKQPYRHFVGIQQY